MKLFWLCFKLAMFQIRHVDISEIYVRVVSFVPYMRQILDKTRQIKGI